jgi:Family of unknown function (DUF6114)
MTRRQRFTHWRRTRPFWAGTFLIGSGLVILAPPFAALHLGDLVITLSTLGGAAALLIGLMLIITGISLWIRPAFRLAAGLTAGLLALVSLLAANLGGLIIGMRLSTAPTPATLTLTTPPGSASRLTGPITLYVEKLCGTLAAGPLGIGFGTPSALLPPITPATPPPAVLPEVTFTQVTAYLAGLSSTQLHLTNTQLSPSSC